MKRKTRVITHPETDSVPARLWTIDDVCHYLQFGRTKIFEFMKQQHNPLPAIHIGPSLRFRKAEIDQWIERWKESVA